MTFDEGANEEPKTMLCQIEEDLLYREGSDGKAKDVLDSLQDPRLLIFAFLIALFLTAFAMTS